VPEGGRLQISTNPEGDAMKANALGSAPSAG
jgi:hypothetical protein